MKTRLKHAFITASFISLFFFIFVCVRDGRMQQMFSTLSHLLPASVFFIDSITTNDLLARYETAKEGGQPLRIVLVPGHDTDRPGTVYRGLREADMALDLAEELSALFANDTEFKIDMTRLDEGYNSAFWNYRESEKQHILDFVKKKKQDMNDLVKSGSVHEYHGVKHNTAPGEVVTTLYAVNKWANDEKVDVVVHIHFNDMAGRRQGVPGDYTGFSMYIPEKQYSNARASRAVAEPIFNRLSRFYPVSDLPLEDKGLVESQDLIAVGAYNTLDSVGMLIEYGYIYEPQFATKEGRAKTVDELAWQTYLGLHDFFQTDESKRLRIASPLSDLNKILEKSSRNKAAVFDLQKALLLTNTYPPQGKTIRQCPLSGNFGECTELSLDSFQSRNLISDEKGIVGQRTLQSLQERLSVFGL